MKKKEVIMYLQKLIDSQSWSLNKAWDYLGEEDYNKVFDAMFYAKELLKEENPDYMNFTKKENQHGNETDR